MNTPFFTDTFINAKEIKAKLHEHWGWYVALGTAMTALGIISSGYLVLTTLVTTMYLGFLLIGAAIVQFIQVFKTAVTGDKLLNILLATLYAIAGGLIVYNPMLQAINLTLLLAIMLIATGAARVIFTLFHSMPYRLLVAINGAISVVLGLLIWSQWPLSGFWVIGLFTAIHLIFTGITWIIIGLACHKL